MSAINFDDSNAGHLKAWVTRRLEAISEADSEVLADYVVALVKSDDPEPQLRANCVENLNDFLFTHTQGFVNDLFEALHDRSYLPGHTKTQGKKPNIPSVAAQPTPADHAGPQSAARPLNAPSGPASQQNRNGQSKKRAWNGDEDTQPTRNSDRPQKQMRRGGRGARGGHDVNGGRGGFQQMPMAPTGFPQLDPNNPIAALMAMQSMGFPMPGLEQMNQAMLGTGQQHGRGRCRDYDEKGFCQKGSNCPYDHGTDRVVVTDEYDPTNANLMLDMQESVRTSGQPQLQASLDDQNFRGRGRGRGSTRGGRGGPRERGGMRGGRSSFSAAGPNHDTRNTSVVVEQIPQEHFTDASVRAFFEEFGPIESITLQEFKRLAIIKYADYASAKRAYESPKVIFDNRFVKVYWHKSSDLADKPAPNTNGNDGGEQPKQEDEEMAIDPEEFAKRQAEAQRAHEEKLRKLAEAESSRAELEKKQKAMAEERQNLMAKLAQKAGKKPTASPAPDGSNTQNDSTPGPQTREDKKEALRIMLAKLEADAQELGIPSHDSNTPAWQYGSYRGSSFPPRGRSSFRGARGRGRGGFVPRGGAPHWQGGSVARLDNRPKTVMVKVLDEATDLASESTGESLRAFLYSIGSFASITPPDGAASADGKQKTTNVAFHERYVAENFLASPMHHGGSIPGVGKVELYWVANASGPSAPTSAPSNGASKTDVEMDGNGVDAAHGRAQGQESREVDWDIADAEDEDRWMQ